MKNLFYSLFGFQRSKNKSSVVLVVFVHALSWCLFFLIPFLFYPVKFVDNHFWLRESVIKIFPIGLFYLNYYFLLPRFFEKRKYPVYFSLVFAAILVGVTTDLALKNGSFNHHSHFHGISIGVAVEKNAGSRTSLYGPDAPPMAPDVIFPSDSGLSGFSSDRLREPTIFHIPARILFLSFNRVASLCMLMVLLGGTIRLGLSFIKSQNEKKLLENANLNAEVNFLKSQINPHFLFNTLNGIYSLAHHRSEQTEEAILKLSELMRYVLYESGTERVELAKDIQYITNYINLQRLRLSSKVSVKYEVDGNLTGAIAPLLLISFIENAFKYGISYAHSSSIHISITVFEETLTLLVENPIVENNSFVGGVGLKNVIRRLDLLYPQKHSLDIVDNGRLHVVNLKLNLKSD
jgi:two-component system LytT family sensor kinase